MVDYFVSNKMGSINVHVHVEVLLFRPEVCKKVYLR
jgi:hypothetical protein